MAVEAVSPNQTWRHLWSHAACDVIASAPTRANLEVVSIGCGWGLRRADQHSCALLIHPSANEREFGDLSLTIAGRGTQIIPRYREDYVKYIETVSDVVETALNAYLA